MGSTNVKRNRILALILLLFWQVSTAFAGLISLLGAGGSSGTQFFVASTGSNANPGTQAQPWLDLTNVNSHTFGPNDCANFNGGNTFGGGTTGIASTTLRCVKSYGTGQATISTGNSTECVKATNVAGVTVGNINCVGGGNTTNTTNGIYITNNLVGNAKLAGPTISGVTVSGYGVNGILVEGANGTAGFNGVSITNSTVHDVSGNSGAVSGTAGIAVTAHAGQGQGATNPSHLNVTITGNTVFNITGTAGLSNHSGNGIIVFQTKTALISQNVAHDFGANSDFAGSGAGGIWTGDADSIVISNNEAYNGKHAVGGIDGGGFDLDGGTVNSIMEYNWAHDNMGYSYLFDNYQDANNLPWGNNTMRFNIGQNSALAELGLAFTRNASGPAYVYNNVLFNNVPGVGNIFFSDGSTGTVTGTVANNIFIETSGGNLVKTTQSTWNFCGNDYYTYGRSFNISWLGTSYTSFAAWQTATGQEKIAGVNVGLTSNPQIYVPGGGFTNGGYVPANLMAYNLQAGSPMIGAGINLLTQFGIDPGATDYYGAAISAAALPVGAANGDFGSFAASCSSASTFLARVSSFTKANNVNYNSLLCGMNSDGDLANFDALYALAAPNSAASLLNLVSSSFSLTTHGTVTFTANTGITGNGTTGYEDTGFNPSTASSPHYVLNSAAVGVYVLNNRTTPSAISDIGADSGSTKTVLGPLAFTGQHYASVNENSTGILRAASTAQGMSIALRGATPTPYQYWFNGAVIGTASAASASVPRQNMALLADINSSGVPGSFSSDQIALAFISSGAINAGHVSQRMNAFASALGINVY